MKRSNSRLRARRSAYLSSAALNLLMYFVYVFKKSVWAARQKAGTAAVQVAIEIGISTGYADTCTNRKRRRRIAEEESRTSSMKKRPKMIGLKSRTTSLSRARKAVWCASISSSSPKIIS